MADVVSALRTNGLEVLVSIERPTFARIDVEDTETGAASKIELGIDWRAYPPTRLDIGPVLHQGDAVANKACALYSRGAVRDYIDINGVLCSGGYTTEQLVRLAQKHDPGFDVGMFAEALVTVRRFPQAAFNVYGMSGPDATALRDRCVA